LIFYETALLFCRAGGVIHLFMTVPLNPKALTKAKGPEIYLKTLEKTIKSFLRENKKPEIFE
jgi:hypothetical protein